VGLQVSLDGRSHRGVYAVCALPITRPRSFISLRRRNSSGRESELGILRELDLWPRAAQEGVVRSLRLRYRFHRVREIRQVRPRGNVLAISFVADQGPAQMELEKGGEGSQTFGADGLLLADGKVDYYAIHHRSQLPTAQQRLLDLYFGD
jgi:hypothetical protein